MTVLEARGLAAGYGARGVLRDVSLALAGGERLALVGPNGAGKTTLLRALAGIVRPTQGEALLDGRALASLSARDRARRVATVPQAFNPSFAFTAREIVALGRTPYLSLFGGPGAADRLAVERALAETECLALADRPFTELSGGERQRAVLAMALAQEADVLLLDEPTAHLDLAHQLRLLALVERLARTRGLAVLAVSHDLGLAARHFDRVAVLDRGTLVAVGAPRDVLTPPLLRVVFEVEAMVSAEDGFPIITAMRVAGAP